MKTRRNAWISAAVSIGIGACTSAMAPNVETMPDSGRGSVQAGGGGSTPSAGSNAMDHCKVELSKSSCEATLDAAKANAECSGGANHKATLQSCRARHIVSWNVVDVPTVCLYETTGELIAARSCSKPLGGCNCFYAGDVDVDSCSGGQEESLCGADAGTNRP